MKGQWVNLDEQKGSSETMDQKVESSNPPSRVSWWTRLGLPLQVGLVAGLVGAALALVGMLRGFAPLTPASLALALLISGGSWGLVAWAVTTAALDSEQVEPDEGGQEDA